MFFGLIWFSVTTSAIVIYTFKFFKLKNKVSLMCRNIFTGEQTLPMHFPPPSFVLGILVASKLVVLLFFI